MNSGGYAYHVLNRAVARDAIFLKDEDYLAFEKAAQRKCISGCRVRYARLLPDAQPLAPGALAGAGRGVVAVYALLDRHPHSSGTARPLVTRQAPGRSTRAASRASRSDARRTSADCAALRRAQSAAGETGRKSGTMEVVEPLQASGGRADALATSAGRQLARPSGGADWLAWVNRATQTAKELESVAMHRRVARTAATPGSPARRGLLGLQSSLRPPGRPKKKAKSR